MVRDWLNERITIQRNTPTRGSSGGQVDSWADISGCVNVRACAQEISTGVLSSSISVDFAKRDWTGYFNWVIDFAPHINPGDRIKHTYGTDTQYYDILDGNVFQNKLLGPGIVFVMKCRLRQV